MEWEIKPHISQEGTFRDYRWLINNIHKSKLYFDDCFYFDLNITSLKSGEVMYNNRHAVNELITDEDMHGIINRFFYT